MTILEQIKAEIERLENYYTSVERHIEALISFLDTLKSEKPMEQEKEFKPCHRTREKLAEWSKTQEGRESYEKVAEEMRKQIVPNDLEEAAKEFAKTSFTRPFSDTPEEVITIIEPDKYAGFIAGAKWDREQMMKEAVGGQVFGAADVKALYEGKVYVISNLVQDTDYNLYPNDKVRIIIVKE